MKIHFVIINKIGLDNIIEHENEITKYAFNKLNVIDFIEIHGGDNKRNSIISFNIKNVHSHEVSSFLDVEGIAIRAGHHCCQPLMKHFNVTGTSRVSFGIYNTKDDIDYLMDSIDEIIKILL